MRRALTIVSTTVVLAIAVGCGATDEGTPVACREGSKVYLAALADAPSAVKLRGETPISGCLVENQQAGDLATVGTTMVTVATRLNAEAREHPGGDANVQLGYLLGAAQRGADRTDGIHAELLRRLSAAARYSPDNRPLPATFPEAYQRGFDAGEAGG